MSSSIKNKIKSYVKSWEKRGYPDGIPDEAPLRLEQSLRVPSYRMICISIMKNDHNLLQLGYSRPPCQIYNELKRAELLQKVKIKPDKQLGIFKL